MNARELLAELEKMNPLTFDEDERERYRITHSALRLRAAAEANDGTTPETDAVDVALGVTDSRSGDAQNYRRLARRIERERNGLAARVRELETDAKKWRAFVGCARLRAIGWAELDAPTPYAHIGLEAWTIHGADSEPIAIEALEKFVAKCIAIDAARFGNEQR